MSIEQPNTIDFLRVDEAEGHCLLAIADPLEWNSWEHLQALEKKINNYLAFVESGEIYEARPDAKGLAVEISIRCRFLPEGEDDWKFLQLARNAIQGAGFRFSVISDDGEIRIPETRSDDPSSVIGILRAAYAAFNARDIDAALATMTIDVKWPKAFKGGFVEGPEEIRAYWTEQWSEINPNVEPVGFHQDGDGMLVDVHQVVRDLAGVVVVDEHVGHRFTFSQGLIQSMEVAPPPSTDESS